MTWLAPQVLLRQGLAVLHVEAPIVDRALARLRPRVLHEEHEAARLGGEILFVVRRRMVDHGARTAGALADLERPCEDVPDLREIVPMARMKGAGLVTDEPRVWLARPPGPRVEDHLAVLAGKAQRLPGHVVDVAVLGAVVCGCLAHWVLLAVL